MHSILTQTPHKHVPSLVLAAAAMMFVNRADADYPGTIVRVEEDWEFVADDVTASGVTCATSAIPGYEGEHMTFEVNHQSQPGYANGGLHLNVWHSDSLLTSVHAHEGVKQSTAGEVVRWTQSISLSEGNLEFEVSNGSSTTWGAFGTGELKVAVPTSLVDLNGYDVNQSLGGLVLATDGVSSFVLKTVRVVTSTGVVLQLDINRNVVVAEEVPTQETPPEETPPEAN